MDSPLRHPPGLFHALQSRQTCYSNHTERALCWNESTICRLFPDDPLAGHSGCVNRLAWNETGDLLASTGDDTDVRLWPYPVYNDSRNYSSLVIPTAHHANIFGLQFLPQSGSSKIATGAMDHSVQLHTIDATPVTATTSGGLSPSGRNRNMPSSPRPTRLGARVRWGPGRATPLRHGQRNLNNENGTGEEPGGDGSGEESDEDEDMQRDNSVVADVHTTQFNCHRGRIKEIQVHLEEPSLFWSVSEDGTIRQYDIRVPTSQQNRFECGNVLLAVQKRRNKGGHGPSSQQTQRSTQHQRQQRQGRSSSEQQHQNLNNVASVATATVTTSTEPVVYRSFSRTQQEQFTASTNLAELKSFAVNPLRPMQLAVAASDKYIRIYDRRRLSLGTFESAANAATSHGHSTSSLRPAGLVTELMPPHIALGPSNVGGGGGLDQTDLHPTHISFSNSGDKLLATYHGNHAFMWSTPSLFAGATRELDFGSGEDAVSANMSFSSFSQKNSSLPSSTWNFNKPRPYGNKNSKLGANFQLNSRNGNGVGPYNLPSAAETHRLSANLALYDSNFIKALYEYNAALKIVPHSPVLLTGRALVLLSRGWMGDKVEALRDAEDAVYYDFDNMVAQVRRAQALFDCGLLESAAVAIRLCRLISGHSGNKNDASSSSHREALKGEYEDELRRLEEKLKEKLGAQLEERMKRQQENAAARESQRRRGLNLHRRSRPSGEYIHQRDSSDTNNNNTAAAAAAAEEEEGRREALSSPSSPSPSPMEIDDLEESKYCSDEDIDHNGVENQEDDDEDKVEYGYKFVDRFDKAFAESLEKEYQKIKNKLQKEDDDGDDDDKPSSSSKFVSSSSSSSSPSASPWLWGALPSSDAYLQRFVGHCNLQTDIKEAVFLGQDDSYVAAGSDDGRIYLYDASSGVCLRTLVGDDDIVNCIRPHPHLPVLATSGIDSTVKLWSPSYTSLAVMSDVEACCAVNQQTLTEGVRRMRGLNERLFEILTQHPGLFGELNRRVRVDLAVGRYGHGGGEDEEDEGEGEGGEEQPPVQCRVV